MLDHLQWKPCTRERRMLYAKTSTDLMNAALLNVNYAIFKKGVINII